MFDSKMVNRVLILVPTLGFGGAEKVAVNLANSYANSGLEVTLGVFRLSGGYDGLLNKNISVVDLDVKRTLLGFVKLFQLIKACQPEVVLSVIVEVNIIVGLLIPFLPKTKTIFRQANTMDLINSKGFMVRNIYKFLMRITYRKANRVVANSIDTEGDLIKNKIIKRDKILVIGNPVLPENISELGDEPVIEPWLLNNNLDVLLTVGRLTFQKQHDLLIRAVNIMKMKNPNIRLIILGHGELYEELQALISALSLQKYIKIIPPVDNPFPYYKNANLFVLASRYEGFGNVLVEAMAFGLNIVCNNCLGGPKTILNKGELGVLVEQSTPGSFAEAVVQQLEVRLVSAESLVEHSKQYNAALIATKYLQSLT